MESSSSSRTLTPEFEEIQLCARCGERQTRKRRKFEVMTAWASISELQRRLKEGAPSPWQVRFLVIGLCSCNLHTTCTVSSIGLDFASVRRYFFFSPPRVDASNPYKDGEDSCIVLGSRTPAAYGYVQAGHGEPEAMHCELMVYHQHPDMGSGHQQCDQVQVPAINHMILPPWPTPSDSR
jgi:hypothetical protein